LTVATRLGDDIIWPIRADKSLEGESMQGYWFDLEQLEGRQFLSVTAATLAGPMAKGTAWTYQVTSGKTTFSLTNKVVGTAKVGKVTCTEIDNTTKVAGATTSSAGFVNLNSAGLLHYKATSKTTATGFSSTAITLPSPANVVYPATMSAGKTYKYTWNETTTTTNSLSPGTQTSKDSIVYTVKLVSDKTTKVKVPAGTFSVYTLQTTMKTTENGQTTSVSSTLYIAASVGMVKSVTGVGTTAGTSVLTKFVKA